MQKSIQFQKHLLLYYIQIVDVIARFNDFGIR